MKRCLILGICLILLSGCSLLEESGGQINKSAQQLANEGSAAYMDGDYKDAIKAYTDLKNWYPFSRYAILAELKIADAHFYLEEYEDALVAYEGFENMHPRNETIPYVINQMGMCWFNQLGTVDRDPAPAENALSFFRRLIRQYPDHEQTIIAKKNIDICINNLAGHELYVASYYKKTKSFKAALKRYEYIVATYPGTPQSDIALDIIPSLSQKVMTLEAKQTANKKTKEKLE
ncbi:MAG: outer membrane protein assembly factor BamD [Desulfobacterales bacterium]|nr:MAG: outer membrane protein assembly factor BamD [Desulfobacterales bacterium]